MMFMCTTKFDIEEKELAFISHFLSKEEREAANEEKESQALDDLDPISDNEEDDSVPIRNQLTTSQLILNKRERNTTSATSTIESENEEDQEASTRSEDEDINLPSPTTLHKRSNTCQRVSGRVRKRSRLLDGYELGRG